MVLYNKKVALILSYVYLVLNMVSGLITSSVIVKTLGATDYGVYQIATTFSSILALLNFGTGTVMIRNIAASKVDKKYSEQESISTITWMSFAICMAMLIVLVVLYFSFDKIYSNSLTQAQILQAKPMFAVSSLNIIVFVFFQTIEGIVHGNDDFVSPKLFSIFHTVIYSVIVIVVFPRFNNAFILVVSNFIIRFIGTCIMLTICRRWYVLRKVFSPRRIKKTIFLSSLSFVLAMLLQVFVNQSITQIPKTIVGIALTPEAVAIFSIALYIYGMFSSVVSVPINIFLPTTVRNVVGKEKENINWDFLTLPCRLNSLLGGVILFGFISIGKSFIVLMYGKEQESAWVLSLILLVPMYINMIIAPCINVLDALNKRLMRSIIISVTAVISLVLTVIFVEKYGLVFCVSSIAFSLLVGNTVAMSIYYKKAMGIPIMKLYFKSLKGILPSLIISCVVTIIVSRNFELNLINFLVSGALFVGVLLICLLLFGLTKQEKNKLFNIIKKFKR